MRTFFTALRGPVTADVSIESPAAVHGSPAKLTVTVGADGGPLATGDLTLTVDGKTLTATIVDGVAQFSVAGLGGGEHSFTVSFAGSDAVKAFERTGSVTVAAGAVRSTGLKVSAGKATGTAEAIVTVAGQPSHATPTGEVTVKATDGTTTRTVHAEVSQGRASATLTGLSEGTWTVSASYAGDANYTASTASNVSYVVNATGGGTDGGTGGGTNGSTGGGSSDGDGSGSGTGDGDGDSGAGTGGDSAGSGGDAEDGQPSISVPTTRLVAGSSVVVSLAGLDVDWVEVGIESTYQRLATAAVEGVQPRSR
ncbi:hypothetical protein GCM10025876_12400 [Demequina litorisediminis]|uniref:Bacterial Ig-like domain-containing protein n=1 Tax=Demequina litorisediminis TaxID=1849022 RepID=A0ABQ6IBG7_9MICO|nr:hypothetical protein GCM10025876_12400 [Demequina litorisediminis]